MTEPRKESAGDGFGCGNSVNCYTEGFDHVDYPMYAVGGSKAFFGDVHFANAKTQQFCENLRVSADTLPIAQV